MNTRIAHSCTNFNLSVRTQPSITSKSSSKFAKVRRRESRFVFATLRTLCQLQRRRAVTRPTQPRSPTHLLPRGRVLARPLPDIHSGGVVMELAGVTPSVPAGRQKRNRLDSRHRGPSS
ncbi:hypothetical protein MRX96_028673 [Rhipicephalus microplus]